MNHLADGLLRRLSDEPAVALSTMTNHLATCPRCSARLEQIGAAAALSKASFQASSAPIDLLDARGKLRDRLASSGSTPVDAGWIRERAGLPRMRLAAAAAFVALVAGFWFTPLRTVAASFLAVFQPHQVAAISLNASDLRQMRALPDLGAFGTVRNGRPPQHAETANVMEAARLVQFHVREPAYLPANVGHDRFFAVAGRTSGAFRFSAAKVRAASLARHAALLPMPANLDGSVLEATIGPIVVATYGISEERMKQLETQRRARGRGEEHSMFRSLDGVAVVQAPVPRITSSGASAAQIETYLIAQPGVPAHLAEQLRALGDPTATLPIPISIDRAYTSPVMVQGVSGVGIGDNTGLGAAVIWQRDGMIFAVAGTQPARAILAIANSLR